MVFSSVCSEKAPMITQGCDQWQIGDIHSGGPRQIYDILAVMVPYTKKD